MLSAPPLCVLTDAVCPVLMCVDGCCLPHLCMCWWMLSAPPVYVLMDVVCPTRICIDECCLPRSHHAPLCVLQQLGRLAVIISYRKLPVIRLPSDALWPVASVLSYPTGIPGQVRQSVSGETLITATWPGCCP